VSAGGAEFVVLADGLAAFRTLEAVCLRGRCGLPCQLHGLSHERGHHEAHPKPHGLACAAGVRGRLFHGRCGFELHQLVHVVEHAKLGLVVHGFLDFGRRSDGVDEELVQGQSEMAEILLQSFTQACGPCFVSAGQVQDGVHVFAQVIIEPGDDDLAQIVAEVGHGKRGHGAHKRVDEEQRLHDLDVEHAIGAQTDESKLRVLEGHRLPGAPLEVGKDLGVHHVGFCPERALKPPGDAHDLVQDGDVGGL